jgi:hypothetical protein
MELQKIMKKSYIIFSLLLTTIAAPAQTPADADDEREEVHLGIKGGFNYSNVYDTQGKDFKAQGAFGLAAGIFLGIPIGKYVGVQPELIVSQKGFSATGNVSSGPYEFSRSSTYIDIPIELMIKPTKYITFVVGPQYSYLAGQKDAFTNPGSAFSYAQEYSNENMRKNIFGLVGGMDVNIRHLVLSSRVGCDLQQNNGDGSSVTPHYKNVWFQTTVGFRL